MSDIKIFIPDKDNEGEWRDIDEGLLDLSSHDEKVRADTIDNFVEEICKMIVKSENNGNYRFYAVEIKQAIADIAEQLKAGGENENYNKEESR